MFNKSLEEIGSLSKELILKTSGKIKIQIGRKFFDLLNNNGTLNVKFPEPIKSIDSDEEVSSSGFYNLNGQLRYSLDGETLNETGKVYIDNLHYLFIEDGKLKYSDNGDIKTIKFEEE